MNNIFPAKTCLIGCLIGAFLWLCAFQACGQINLKLPKHRSFTGWDYTTFGLSAIAGVLKGGLEAQYADVAVFEKKFSLDPYSFGGSREWERNYIGNRYHNEDGSVNPHKSEILGNFGRDFRHTATDLYVVSYGLSTAITCTREGMRINMNFYKTGDKYLGIKLGKRSRKWLPLVSKLAINNIIRSGTENLTYKWLRK